MYKSKNEFSLYIEELKAKLHNDSYFDTIVYYYTNESDQEIDEIIKMCNDAIVDKIRFECENLNLIKTTKKINRLNI